MRRAFKKRYHGAIGGIDPMGKDRLEPESALHQKPLRDAISAAALKLERNRDATQAMKDHDAAKRDILAKTARLRAERLARDAKSASAAKLPAEKKK